MKVIIAGGRDFEDYELLTSTLDTFFENCDDVTIISGCARGADTLGIRYAKEKNLPCIKIPAKWDLYGIRAGYIRNKEMAEIADEVIVFWDGKSKGSKNMIEVGKRMGLQVNVAIYEKPNPSYF